MCWAWASQVRTIWALERPVYACIEIFYEFGVKQKHSHITFMNLLKSEGLMSSEGLAKQSWYIPCPINPITRGEAFIHILMSK